MRPVLYVLTFLSVMGLAFWAYRENYATQQALKDMAALQDDIAALREALTLQRAEWAYLNRPERLRQLATLNFDRLGLFPLTPEQLGAARDIALVIALVLPDRLTTAHNPYEAIVMLVGCWLIIPGKQRHQPSGFVVLIRRDRSQRILLNRQSAFVIVGLKVLGTVRVHALHQPRPLVMHVDFLAAIGV